MPAGALGDARRPAPLRRRRAPAARPASPTRRSTEFVRRAAGGDVGAGAPELARAIGELTDGNAFLVCELWRALVETGVGRGRRRRDPADPAADASSAPRRASARSSASGSRAWRRATIDLLELAATAGAEFELDVVRRAAGLAEPELLAALDEAVRSGMIEELPSRAAGLPLHARARAPRALRPAHRRAAGRAPPARRRGARARRGALGPRARRPRAPLRRRRAARRRRARRSSTTCRAARAATAALAFDEAAARLRTALELRDRRARAERAEVFLELGTASHRARQGARRARGVHGGGARSPASCGDARAARAGRDRLRGRVLAPGHRRPGRGRAARGGGGRARRRELRAARRAARRARPRARLPRRARARRDRAHERDRDGAAARRPRAASPRC